MSQIISVDFDKWFLRYCNFKKSVFAPKPNYFLTFEWIVRISPNLAHTYYVTKSLVPKSLNDLGSKVKVTHDLDMSNFNFLLECYSVTKFGTDIEYKKAFNFEKFELHGVKGQGHG